MKIKKIVSIALAAASIIQIGSFVAFAKDSCLQSVYNENEVDQIIKGSEPSERNRFVSWNGIIYDISIKEYKPTTSYDKTTGKITYRKTVEETESYYSEKDSSLFLTQKLSITFTYDKERAWIADKKDIIYSTRIKDKNWRFVDHVEYLNDDQNTCLFSAVWKLYSRESAVNDWDYQDTAFLDVICTPTGELIYKYK